MSQDTGARDGQQVPPDTGSGRWTSFVVSAGGGDRVARGLHEEANARHRLRVEHDNHTLLIHLSDEDAAGWTTIAVDRASRRWAVAQDIRQADTARQAYDSLYQA